MLLVALVPFKTEWGTHFVASLVIVNCASKGRMDSWSNSNGMVALDLDLKFSLYE
jgi:hypothetical protein